MASLLRVQLAHARLCPASEHPELPPATATALPTRPQSPRVTRRLQPKSTSAFPLSLLVFFCLVTFASICPVIHGVGLCHVCASGSHPLRRIRRRRRLCHGCLRKPWVYLSSAQLGSSPSRWPFARATSHTQRHTNHLHLFCILIHHHPPQHSQHLPWSKGSEMMHRIEVDSCTRVFSGWPQPQSHFPTSPAATVPGELPPVPARSIPYSNPPPSLEVIAPTLDAPGQPATRPPSLARE